MKNMRLLIDTNVIIDVLQKREPYAEDSLAILKLCETGLVEGYISTLSFANIVYVLRKRLVPTDINTLCKNLSLIFRFADLTGQELLSAAEIMWEDYEDAIQYVTARKMHADYIITRNEKDYADAEIKIMSPKEFVSKYKNIHKTL